jgi:hypothetical protein
MTTSCESRSTHRKQTRKIDFGMEAQLRSVPLYTDNDGNEIVTSAFAPIKNQHDKGR